MKNLITPIVHGNGTSKSALLEQQLEIMNNLRGALKAMREATPNGRDYYPVSADAVVEARDAFNERYNAINQIFADFEKIALEIHKQ